jgi:hypothetical protein
MIFKGDQNRVCVSGCAVVPSSLMAEVLSFEFSIAITPACKPSGPAVMLVHALESVSQPDAA